MVGHFTLVEQQLARNVGPVEVSSQLLAASGRVLHGVSLRALQGLHGVNEAQLLGVVQAPEELQDALVQGLHHVAGVVRHPPLRQAGGHLQLQLDVHVQRLLDVVPGVPVSEGRAVRSPPVQLGVDEVDGDGDVGVPGPGGPQVRGQGQGGVSELVYGSHHIMTDFFSKLFHLSGVCPRCLEVYSFVK